MKTGCLYLEAAQMCLLSTFQHFFRLWDKWGERWGGGDNSYCVIRPTVQNNPPPRRMGREGKHRQVESTSRGRLHCWNQTEVLDPGPSWSGDHPGLLPSKIIIRCLKVNIWTMQHRKTPWLCLNSASRPCWPWRHFRLLKSGRGDSHEFGTWQSSWQGPWTRSRCQCPWW